MMSERTISYNIVQMGTSHTLFQSIASQYYWDIEFKHIHLVQQLSTPCNLCTRTFRGTPHVSGKSKLTISFSSTASKPFIGLFSCVNNEHHLHEREQIVITFITHIPSMRDRMYLYSYSLWSIHNFLDFGTVQSHLQTIETISSRIILVQALIIQKMHLHEKLLPQECNFNNWWKRNSTILTMCHDHNVQII